MMIQMCTITCIQGVRKICYYVTMADQQLHLIKRNATFCQHCVFAIASKSLWEKERHVCSDGGGEYKHIKVVLQFLPLQSPASFDPANKTFSLSLPLVSMR